MRDFLTIALVFVALIGVLVWLVYSDRPDQW